MDIAQFEQRATEAERFIEEITKKVNILEQRLLNDTPSTASNTVSESDYKKLKQENEALKSELERNKFRINFLIRELNNEQQKNGSN